MIDYKVIGAAALAASLAKAARDIANLEAGFTAAADVIEGAQRAGAPRRTGRLAGAMRTTYDGPNLASLTNPLVYAVPIHWGRPAHHIEANPYVIRAARNSEPQWTAAAEKAAQQVCNEVKGA